MRRCGGWTRLARVQGMIARLRMCSWFAAQSERVEDPQAAVRTLAHVASVYRGLKTDGYLAEALYQEAVAAQAAGDEVGARARLQEAINAIERQSASFASPETRAHAVRDGRARVRRDDTDRARQ